MAASARQRDCAASVACGTTKADFTTPRQAAKAGGTDQWPPNPRITSYNVCYTKLLRIEAEIRTLIDKTKRKHGVKPEAEVIFALDSLYLMVPGSN